MDVEEIRRTIRSFPRWHYRFDLQGEITPIWNEDQANRHEQRASYFFDPLVEFFGGSLVGKRVLDLGCNAGFWALKALQAGADFVLGIDGRQMHVDQAEFVLEVNGVEHRRYRFEIGDVYAFDYDPFGSFDVVLCLGLLYHVNKPVELMERIAAINTDLVLIDTALSLAPGAYFEVRYESPEIPANALDHPLVLYPSAQAVVQLARSHGYSVGMLKPRFSDWTGCWDYEHRKRRAFVALKGERAIGPSFELEEVGRPRRDAGAPAAG
jgi:tRNA (mo5U34)-methyltransferase